MPQNLTRNLVVGMLLASIAAIVYVLFSAAAGPEDDYAFERYATGPLAELDFAYAGEVPEQTEFIGPDGKGLTFEALQGEVILVNFWATWCGPCEREMPSLGALQTALQDKPFKVIAVSVDDEKDKTFAAEQLRVWTGNALSMYHTPEFALTYAVGVRGFPTTVLYDRKGREIARYAGELDWASIEAVSFIRAVIEADA